MIDTQTSVAVASLKRLPVYLKCLKQMKKDGAVTVSSVALASSAMVNPSVVKKDLSLAGVSEGKPRVGYLADELINDIETFLGYNNTKDAVLVGAGRMGQALMSYSGFEEYGLNILAGFDVSDKVIGTQINGKMVLPIGKLESAVERLNVKLAILTTPAESAQLMTDVLVKAGIRAIWNFTPAHLMVPPTVALKNENVAESLAVLSNQLNEILKNEDA
jgi:redox-sensing transcriptional repressor